MYFYNTSSLYIVLVLKPNVHGYFLGFWKVRKNKKVNELKLILGKKQAIKLKVNGNNLL